MLRVTYGTETEKPAVDTWQTVFVFGDGCVERVDTPELLKPMELDRGQAREDRRNAAKRASNKAKKDYTKSWRTANANRLKAYHAQYNAARKDSKKEYMKAWTASNKDHRHAYHKAWLAVNKKRASAQQKAWKDANKYRYLCPNCKDWPDSRIGRKGYDGYCATCFKFLFPKDPRTKAYGFKELQTKTFIDKHFQDFRHNKYIETAHPCDCTKRRRIDHRRCIGNTLICVETDERAHQGYSVQDERDRYHDAIMDWGGKLVFIRFNPDGKGFSMDEKHARLAAEINKQVRRVEAEENTELCERVYLFYPATSRFIAAQ